MELVTIIKSDEIRRIDEDTEWMAFASCKGLTDIFFPARGQNKIVQLAIKICSKCPVQLECLAYATRNRETIGIWGGYSERQRRKARTALRKERLMQCPLSS